MYNNERQSKDFKLWCVLKIYIFKKTTNFTEWKLTKINYDITGSVAKKDLWYTIGVV